MKADIQRLVVRSPNWVGDVVHSLPAIEALRVYFPSAELTIVARGEAGSVLRSHGSVDRVLSFPGARGVSHILQLRRMAARLRQESFDLAIVLTNAFEGALLFFMAGVPRRIGYATDGRRWLLTEAVPCPEETRRLHQADYYLALLAQLGISANRAPVALRPTQQEKERVEERLMTSGWRRDHLLIALCPGASYGSAKRWPVQNFAALAKRLVDDLGATILLLGAPSENVLGAEIVLASERQRVLNLIGQTTLREAMALLSLARVTVSNDSGLLHLAVSVGSPAVALFGSTDPDRTGPTGSRVTLLREQVSCAPCELRECPIDHRCMEWISVERVYGAIAEQLRSGNDSLRDRNQGAVRQGDRAAPARNGAAPSVAVFLDRDGTVNKDVGYLNDPDRLDLFPGVGAAIRALNDVNIRVILVTNQSGIARGLVTDRQLELIHGRLLALLREEGAVFDGIYVCPHHPDDGCQCRKPGRALVDQAAEVVGIDLTRSVVIGDKLVDVQLAHSIGAKGILVRTGYGNETIRDWSNDHRPPDYVADDLPAAVRWLLKQN